MAHYEEFARYASLLDKRKHAKKLLALAKIDYDKICAECADAKQQVDSLYEEDNSE